MKTLEECKVIARCSDPEWVGEELFRLQKLVAEAQRALSEEQRAHTKTCEIFNSAIDRLIKHRDQLSRDAHMGPTRPRHPLLRTSAASAPIGTSRPAVEVITALQ